MRSNNNGHVVDVMVVTSVDNNGLNYGFNFYNSYNAEINVEFNSQEVNVYF